MRLTLVLLLLATAARAQETAEKAPELHKIFVPYKKLDELLGTDKERVMVPYKEFLELWRLKYGPNASPDRPPVPFVVESAAYQGRIVDGVASFQATIEIEVFEDAWQRVPLGFGKVAFEEVAVDGAPGVLAPAKDGYDLLLRGKGRHVVTARFVAGVAKDKEHATCAFDLPEVPLHRLTFRVPGKGTEIVIAPARAHTTSTEGEETVLMAFLGPQRSVTLTWRYQPEETETEPPLVFATDLVDVRVEERVLRGTVQFDMQVLRTPAQEFRIAVPAAAQVLEVTGAQIRTWGFADEARRTLRVALHAPVSGAYSLAVSFEAAVTVPGDIALPVFRVDGATREIGFLRIQTAEGVGVRPGGLENVFQVDLNTLPEKIRGGERALGFRFPAMPYAVGLRAERIAPLVSLLSRVRVQVERRTMKLDTALQFNVERAGLFDLRIEVPPGITLTDIGDKNLVDSWRESTDGERRILTIDLRGRRIGAFTLPIRAETSVDLAEKTLKMPLLKVLGVDREEGTLAVYMDPGIKASATVTGVVPMEPQALAREDRFESALPLAFAWRWRGAGASVTFAVEPRKPKVTCDVQYVLLAEEGRLRVRANLVYTVEYSGVETFRFRVPKRIADRLEVDGRNIREKPHADDPVEEGKEPTVTYTITLQGPSLGQVALRAEYDDVFDQPIAVNQSRPVAVPAFLPLDVERTTAFVAIQKAPVIKVEVASDAYEQIDAAELPDALKSDDVFLALRRFDAPAAYRVVLTKHEYQPVADLVVRHMHLKTVVVDADHATTTAFFEILNNDRQFLAVKLPAGSEILELRKMGRPEKPRLGDGGVLLIPLETGLRKDASFELAIAYKHPIKTDGSMTRETRLAGPELPAYEDAPKPFCALLTWRVHYPKEWRVTGFDGNVRPEDPERESSWLRIAIDRLGAVSRPGGAPAGTTSLNFKDIVPTPTQRESVERLFTNGAGDGALVIEHATGTTRAALFVLALLAGAAVVIIASRSFKPIRIGIALVIVILICLAFAGAGWGLFWNGMLLAVLVTAPVVALMERGKVRA
jgi:hypothetical protein